MKSWSVSRQVSVLVAALVVALLVTAGATAYISASAAAADRVARQRADQQDESLFALVESFSQMGAELQRLLREKDPDEMEKLVESGKKLRAAAVERMAAAGAAGGEVESCFRTVTQTTDRTIEPLLQGNIAQANETFLGEATPAQQKLLASVRQFQQSARERRQKAAEAQDRADGRKQAVLYIAVLLAALGMAGLGAFLVRRINRSLHRAVEELSVSAQEMSSASNQVSRAAQDLAQGATEQASALEQTSKAASQVTGVVRGNTEHTSSVAQMMGESAARAEDANQRLGQLNDAMQAIQASSQKISSIIRVIDEIAFQTNILALNAAVEAARAGESGLGFAVVANEVRTLAQRSAQAARDTTALIEESTAKSGEGAMRVDQVAETVRYLTDQTRAVNEIVAELTTGAKAQLQGLESVTRSLQEVEVVTQRSGATSEETAAAAEELSAQADTLRRIVGDLSRLVGRQA